MRSPVQSQRFILQWRKPQLTAMLEAFVHLFDASKSLHSFSRLSGWLRRSHGSAVQFRDLGRHSPPLPSSGVVVVVHCHVQVGVPDGLHPFVHPVQGCQKLPSAADGGGGDDGSLVVVVVFRLLLVVENEAETNGHFEIGFRIRSVHGKQKSVREQQQRSSAVKSSVSCCSNGCGSCGSALTLPPSTTTGGGALTTSQESFSNATEDDLSLIL